MTDLRHPIFRPFGPLSANLGQVRFERTWRIRPEGWDIAARFSDGTPALLERAEGRGRIVAVRVGFRPTVERLPGPALLRSVRCRGGAYVSGCPATIGLSRCRCS